MTDPNGLPTALTTSFPSSSAGGVGYMMMSYPGRPPMVPSGIPMPPAVGMPYPMSIGAAGPTIMPTLMTMPPMIPPATMVTPQQMAYRGAPQRPRKPKPPQPHQITKPPMPNMALLSNGDAPKGPPVTVFVGNITEKAPDLMMRHILNSCGHVVSWKRVQAFGFCEFGNPDAALRAIRLMHDMAVGPKKLVIKVDSKAQSVLDEYKIERRTAKYKGDPEKMAEPVPDNSDDDYMDYEMKFIDENARNKIMNILKDYKELMAKYVAPDTDGEKPKTGAEVIEARINHTQQKLNELAHKSASHSDMKIDLETVDYAEDGKRDLISREIGKFREIMKKQEEEKQNVRKRQQERVKERGRRSRSPSTASRGRSHDSFQSISSTRSASVDSRSPRRRTRVSRSRSRDRDRDRKRERSRARHSERERKRERERERDRDRDRRAEREYESRRDRSVADIDRSSDALAIERDVRMREREARLHEREPSVVEVDPPRTRDEGGSRSDLVRLREEEEEAKDLKKQERAMREREIIYQERLRKWEERERRKLKEIEYERQKQRQKDEERQRDAKRLKEFLEDYDDIKDDLKFYKGREFHKKLKEREREIELDNRDRQKEKDELEELKMKIYSGDSKNPDYEFAKLLKAREDLYQPRILIDVTEEHRREKERELERARLQIERDEIQRERQTTAKAKSPVAAAPKPAEAVRSPPRDRRASTPASDYSRSASPAPPSPAGTPESPNSPDESSTRHYNDRDDSFANDKSKKKKLDVKDVFNNDDEDAVVSNKRRKLVPLDYNEEKMKECSDTPKSQEEKRKHIKMLIEKIPTDKCSLFEYSIDWSSVDNGLMEKRIRPWINKKIIEYIGEPEPTLVDFICAKVLAGSAPQGILDDVQMVLDEEAEVFVVKMWRLLIYEVEAKKLGLGPMKK